MRSSSRPGLVLAGVLLHGAQGHDAPRLDQERDPGERRAHGGGAATGNLILGPPVEPAAGRGRAIHRPVADSLPIRARQPRPGAGCAGRVSATTGSPLSGRCTMSRAVVEHAWPPQRGRVFAGPLTVNVPVTPPSDSPGWVPPTN